MPDKTANRRNPLIFGVAAAIVLLILLGIGLGWSVFIGRFEKSLNGNLVIQRYIGEIDRFEFELIASADIEGENVFVFLVEGSNGSGVVTAEFVTGDADSEEIRSGTLQLPSGEIYDLLAEDGEPQ